MILEATEQQWDGMASVASISIEHAQQQCIQVQVMNGCCVALEKSGKLLISLMGRKLALRNSSYSPDF